MALWNGTKLFISSAAVGPAFDGCGIRCGMPAESGAVYRVDYDDTAHAFRCQTIGEGAARGLCGSGLVDVVATLLKHGLIRPSGRVVNPGTTDFHLCSGERDVFLSRRDIDVFQRAKAAIGAGMVSLAAAAGVELEQVESISLCGAFGRHLNIENAQAVGLLPGCDPGGVELCGNAALAGSELLVLSSEAREMAQHIRGLCQIVDLAGEPAFEQHYPDHLSLRLLSSPPLPG